MTRWIRLMHFGLAERMDFYRQLGSFAEKQVEVTEALDTLTARDRARSDQRALICGDIAHALSVGRVGTLADALKKWVPGDEYVLIEAAEQAGNLATGLERSVWFTMARQEIRAALTGLLLPLIMLALLVGVFVLYSLEVTPTFLGLVPMDEWPAVMRGIHHTGGAIITWWPAVLVVAALFGWGVSMTLSRVTGPFREAVLDRVPPYNVYRQMTSASIMTSLSVLLSAGVALEDAIRKIRTAHRRNRWLAQYLTRIEVTLTDTGQSPSKALDIALFTPRVRDHLAIYSLSGGIETVLAFLSDEVVKDAIRWTNKFAASVATVLEITFYLFVAVTVIAVFQLSGSIGSEV